MAVRGPGTGSKSTVRSPCRRRIGSRRRPVTARLVSPDAMGSERGVGCSPKLIERRFELRQEIAEDGEAAVPKGRVVDREAETTEEDVGGFAAARREELEVAREERRALLAIALVERQ